MEYRIVNARNELVLAERALVASTLWARTKGLLGKRELKAGEALIIERCAMVHMWFMRFAIDVVFCAENDTVVWVVENLRPWAISKYVSRATHVVELPVGAIKSADLKVGDALKRLRE